MNVELSVIAYPQVNPMSYHILCVDSDTRRLPLVPLYPEIVYKIWHVHAR